MEREELVKLGRVMIQANASLETVLLALRAEGASRWDSALALREAGVSSVKQIGKFIDNSDAWADTAGERAASVDSFFELLDREAEPGGSGTVALMDRQARLTAGRRLVSLRWSWRVHQKLSPGVGVRVWLRGRVRSGRGGGFG